jgi:hypothetical protein
MRGLGFMIMCSEEMKGVFFIMKTTKLMKHLGGLVGWERLHGEFGGDRHPWNKEI